MFLDASRRRQRPTPTSLRSSEYQTRLMPESTAFGEVLLTIAHRNCSSHNSTKHSSFTSQFLTPSRIFQYLIVVSTLFFVSFLPLSIQLARLFTGCMLLLLTALGFLILSLVLQQWSMSQDLGRMLLHRVLSMHENWELYPFRTFIENFISIGSVLIGFTLSTNVLWTIGGGVLMSVFGIIAAEVCSSSIELVELELEKNKQTPRRPPSVVLVCGCLFYFLYSSADLFMELIILSHRERRSVTSVIDDTDTSQLLIHCSVTYVLLILVLVSVIIASELLMLWQTTQRVGMVVQSRLIHAQRNWREHRFRSVSEVIIMYVSCFYGYQQFQCAVVMTIQFGTFVAIGMICCGEYFCPSLGILHSTSSSSHHPHPRQNVNDVPNPSNSNSSTRVNLPTMETHWTKFLPVAVALGNVCLRFGQLIQMKHVVVWLVIVLVCSALLYGTLSKVHSVESPDRSLPRSMTIVRMNTRVQAWIGQAGVILTDRCLNLRLNWRHYPFRSMIEAGCWVGVFLGTFGISTSMVLASFVATCSGMLITLAGEIFHRNYFVLMDASSANPSNTSNDVHLFFIGYGTTMMLYCVYHHIASIELAFFLATLSGMTFICMSELLLIWKPTQVAGTILQSRIYHWKDNWSQDLERSLIETGAWLGMTYGSYALSHDWILALQLGTVAAICVTLSGEYFRHLGLIPTHELDNTMMGRTAPTTTSLDSDSDSNQPQLHHAYSNSNDDDPQQQQCAQVNHPTLAQIVPKETVVSQWRNKRPKILPFILLVGYLGTGTFHWIFEHMRNIELAFVLVIAASLVLLTIADVLVCWKPTQLAGYILHERVVKISRNWSEHPVRSFTELGCWLGVMYGSYAIYHDCIVAVQVGTFSGVMVTLSGELIKRKFLCTNPSSASSRSLGREILVSSAKKRAPDDKLFHDCHDSAQAKEGENLPGSSSSSSSSTKSLQEQQILPSSVIGFVGFVGFFAWKLIYTHLHNLEIAFVLATFTGVGFVVAGDLFVIWQPTRGIGLILQQRILHFQDNLHEHYPIRTMIELVMLGIILTSSFYCSGCDVTVTIQVGTISGVSICLLSEWTCHQLVQSVEDHLESRSKYLYCGQRQASKLLMELPYDVLFEIGRFCSPEDLLRTRVCCRRVNDLLRAESFRFWMLHPPFGFRQKNQDQHRRLNQTQNRRQYQMFQLTENGDMVPVRSLVYEALHHCRWLFFQPYVFFVQNQSYYYDCDYYRARASSTITMDLQRSCVCRWIYFNAHWIRKQKLELNAFREGEDDEEEKATTERIKTNRRNRKKTSSLPRYFVLTPDHPGFMIFRHMPEKLSLNIQVSFDARPSLAEKNDEKMTRSMRISVPREMYVQIQEDPLIFVMSESLKHTSISMTSWHFLFVLIGTSGFIYACESIRGAF